MKTLGCTILGMVSFILVSCGESELLNDKNLNSSWTPQYGNITEYFSMANQAASDGAVFAATQGFNGTVKNQNGTGMTSVDGVVSFGIEFDGVDDRVVVPYANSTNSNQFSISVWIKIPNATSFRCILSSRDESPARGFALCINSGAEPLAMLGQGGSAGNWTVATGTPLLSNIWVHLVATFDGTNLRLYKNGVLEASPLSAIATNTLRPLYIGAGGTELDPGATDFFRGAMDEVAVWSTALTSDEVLKIYTRQTR